MNAASDSGERRGAGRDADSGRGTSPIGWLVPRPARRFGERLLTQQLWCWGQDILFAEGNLLIRFGFDRHRDPTDRDRSTCYRTRCGDLNVALWGFGLFVGHRRFGGLVIGRFDFLPRWAPIESLSLGIHSPDRLPRFGRPRDAEQWERARRLWRRSLIWISDYERRIVAAVGADHRRDCVDRWLYPYVRPDRMARAWRTLAAAPWRDDAAGYRSRLGRLVLPASKRRRPSETRPVPEPA